MKKVGILQFPGTNCERDTFKALSSYQPKILSYQDSIPIKDYQAFVLPGGFSYGDYLRSGILAAHSPAMKDVIKASQKGYPVLGICNGFQILCETQLLEGSLLKNKHNRFFDGWVGLKLQNPNRFWGGETIKNIELPVAHGEGCYYISQEGLKKVWDKQMVWLTYQENPNGSVNDIAGLMNEQGNVAGLMPHPERAMESWMSGKDGQKFFQFLEGV